MPNRNYINGRNKEYRIIKFLKAKGFIAVRSAGSHSPIDVWAINPETKEIMLIQSKLGKGAITNKEAAEMEEFFNRISGDYKVRCELWKS